MSVYKDIVAGILRDHIMDDILIADYLLFVLNQHQQFKWDNACLLYSGSIIHLLPCSYAEFYGLPQPLDDITVVLNHIAKRLGALQKGNHQYLSFSL